MEKKRRPRRSIAFHRRFPIRLTLKRASRPHPKRFSQSHWMRFRSLEPCGQSESGRQVLDVDHCSQKSHGDRLVRSYNRAMKIVASILFVCLLVSGLYGQGDWPAYAYSQAGQRYSPLTQINARNVSSLKLAWQYGVDPRGIDLNPATRALTATEAVPIMAAGLLYTPTV